jgi:hypothetical protein
LQAPQFEEQCKRIQELKNGKKLSKSCFVTDGILGSTVSGGCMKKWQIGRKGRVAALEVVLFLLLFAFLVIDLTFLVSIVIQNPTAQDLQFLVPLILSPVVALFVAVLKANVNRK